MDKREFSAKKAELGGVIAAIEGLSCRAQGGLSFFLIEEIPKITFEDPKMAKVILEGVEGRVSMIASKCKDAIESIKSFKGRL